MIRPWFRHAAVPWKTTATQTRASGENRVSTKPGVLQAVGRELPPRRCRLGAVAVRAGLAGCGEPGERGSVLFHHMAEGGGLAGEFGQPGADRGVMVGMAGVQPGELLGVGGELVDDGGDRVVAGHGHVQGKEVPPPGSHSAGT